MLASLTFCHFFRIRTMKRTLLDSFGEEQSAKVTRIGITVTQSDEASTSSNEPTVALLLLSPASFATCSGSTIDRRCWVRDIHQDEGTEVFVMHADGGILCLLCNKHKTQGRDRSSQSYAEKPAYPARHNRLKAHLNSDMHKLAVEMDQQMRQYTFHALHQDRVEHKTITVAQRVQLIYWVLKEENALRKVVSLHLLFNKIGLNYRLSDFQHTSSTSVSDFVALISQQLTDKIVQSEEGRLLGEHGRRDDGHSNAAAVFHIRALSRGKRDQGVLLRPRRSVATLGCSVAAIPGRSSALRAHHDITTTVQEGDRRYSDSADALLSSSSRFAEVRSRARSTDRR